MYWKLIVDEFEPFQNGGEFKPRPLLDLRSLTDGEEQPGRYTLQAVVFNPEGQERPYLLMTPERKSKWLRFQDNYVTPIAEEEVSGKVCYMIYVRDDVVDRILGCPDAEKMPQALGKLYYVFFSTS